MIPSILGLVVGLAGFVLLLWARTPAMFSFVLLCSLMGGSAAFVLTALGGSSIPPVQFALGFLLLRLLLPGSGRGSLLRSALAANAPLLVFILYGVAMALIAPRVFAGEISVVPTRVVNLGIYATVPLAFTTQNITTAVYMLGTLFATLASYMVCRIGGGPRALVRTAVLAAWIHIYLGVSGVLLKNTGYSAFLDFFRNGSYAQLDQRAGSFVRMNGIMPEPSAYASLGLLWFLFLFECWLRDVMPRRTGPAALAMALTLVASTSSTAYVGLGGYAAVLVLRMLVAPQALNSAKLLRIGLALFAAVLAVSTMLILNPGLAGEFGALIVDMTLNKQNSESGLERAFWAAQGLKAFEFSSGLGIGPGSFRSSSLFTAIIGSMGIPGGLLFVLYLLHVLKPLRASTYSLSLDPAVATGVAAAWTAVCLLIPASVSSPTPDPGIGFGIFAGAALALRRAPVKRRAAPAAPPPSFPMTQERVAA